MSFLGMGPLEILLILVIAFIFLGPERMIDSARLLGRAVREARRFASEIPRIVVEDDDIKLVSAGKSSSLTGLDRDMDGQAKPERDEPPGPVPFGGVDAQVTPPQTERENPPAERS